MFNHNQTIALFHFTIHNPSKTVPLLVKPAGLHISMTANGVQLLSSRNGVMAPNATRSKNLIQPGKTRTVTIAVKLDNNKIPDWFKTHVRNGERSQLKINLQYVANLPGTDRKIQIPAGDGITYRCTMQTAILEDNQSAATTCGQFLRLFYKPWETDSILSERSCLRTEFSVSRPNPKFSYVSLPSYNLCPGSEKQ